MAVKSQIDIDVDANEFLAFKAKFDEYAAALAKAPAAWRGIGFRPSRRRATGRGVGLFEFDRSLMRSFGSSRGMKGCRGNTPKILKVDLQDALWLSTELRQAIHE
jgi:hypothetical protein